MYEYFETITKNNVSFLEAIKKAAGAAFSTGFWGLFLSDFRLSFHKLFLQSVNGEVCCFFK
jgi:hypothetical protein